MNEDRTFCTCDNYLAARGIHSSCCPWEEKRLAQTRASPAPDVVERLRNASDDPYFQLTPGVQEWLDRNWKLREEAAALIEAQRKALDIALSRGCDHCADSIRRARAFTEGKGE